MTLYEYYIYAKHQFYVMNYQKMVYEIFEQQILSVCDL
jgi:hypothetical protein